MAGRAGGLAHPHTRKGRNAGASNQAVLYIDPQDPLPSYEARPVGLAVAGASSEEEAKPPSRGETGQARKGAT